MNFLKKIFISLLILSPLAVFSADPATTSVFVKPDIRSKVEIVKAFKYYKNVTTNISTPRVLEVSFGQEFFSIPSFAVYNLNTSSFEPYLLYEGKIKTKAHIKTNDAIGNSAAINDEDYGTYLEFPLNGNSSKAELIFNFDKPITSSFLSFFLDDYVALPESISIFANVAGKEYTVLSPVKPYQSNVNFPTTTSSSWRVVFDYVQPLRISEMEFFNKATILSSQLYFYNSLRFLAQPGQNYEIYFDADRFVESSIKEAGDLSSNKDVVRLVLLVPA